MLHCSQARQRTPVALESSVSPCCAPISPRQSARRKQVADAARLLFSERGFQNTRMEQISTAAGVKVGQIYRDFDSKEAIVADIVRGDLDRLLDEAALRQAIAAGDAVAVRRWIADFLGHDGGTSKGRLLAQIVFEAARNERIAALFQHGDCRIRDCLERAIAVIAPGEARRPARLRLVEIVMLLLIGMPQRLIAAPDTDMAALAAGIIALVERELDVLIAQNDGACAG